jgi:Mitochondrial ribosomal protein (VAR1)
MKEKLQILAQFIEENKKNHFKSKDVLNSIKVKEMINFKLKELQKRNLKLDSFHSKKNQIDLFNQMDDRWNQNNKIIFVHQNKEILYLFDQIKEKHKYHPFIQMNNLYFKLMTVFNHLSKNTNMIYSQQINYHFNTVHHSLIKKVYKLLFQSFLSMNCLISKPVFNITNDKVIIFLFIFMFKQNYQNDTLITMYQNKMKILSFVLSQWFKKPVELDLNRIYYPYFDNNIFINLLVHILNQIRVRNIIKKIFKKAIIKNPFKINQKKMGTHIISYISGINIKIAGRLLTQKIVPRKTNQMIRRGAFSRVKINYLDQARYTNKNKRGAFSITMRSGQFLI